MESGSKLAHYEILSPLGKGGMGEVWRARDTKLGREVAIKSLPEEFANDADRVARFRREAHLLASLNHPNIAAIHGFEEDDGTHFLVLELVEGDTLADRLKRGAIQVEESLKLALQVTEALEAAHEKGVIHRDLKPANIKITPDGKVKVLDFGLAKAFGGDEAGVSVSNSPTLSMAATQQGIILGTAAYMSPEQARGNAADLRSDIWAFGCVLFEMLTGRQTFEGGTVSDIMAGVLAKAPLWSSLPANLHPRIRFLLERCLEKESKDRCQSIAEARADVQKALAEPGVALTQPVAEVAQARPQLKLPWVATVLLTAIVVGLAAWNLKPLPAGRMSQFEFIPPASAPLFMSNAQSDLAISPDGTRIVYPATGDRNLHLRALDQIEPVELTNLGQILNGPFFSPDGTQVGFTVNPENSLRRVSIQGGPPQTIVADIGSGLRGASWGPDNTIVFATNTGGGLMRVAAVGGEPTALTTADQSEGSLEHWWPEVLPDGRAVLFTAWSGSDETSQIVVLNLETGEQEILVSGGTSPRYLSTGHILYATAGSLWAVPFNIDDLEVTGDSVPVLENLSTKPTGAANFSVSEDGVLVYVPDAGTVAAAPNAFLEWVDRNGVREPLPVPPRPYRQPQLSPDGTRLAVQTTDANGESDIWVYDLNGSTQMRQMTGEGNNMIPIWTPDGERLMFSSDRDGEERIYWQLADLSGVAEPLTPLDERLRQIPSSWTPDGRTLSFTKRGGSVQSVWTLSLDEGGEPELFVSGGAEGNQSGASAFSPDVQWLVYRNMPGEQLFMQPFPATGTEIRVTQETGSAPMWSRDGSELFYRRGIATLGGASAAEQGVRSSELVAVDITLDATPRLSNERVLPVEGFMVFVRSRDYDITPDGERFLMVFPAGQTEASEPVRPQINIVLNWFEELKERVPVP